MRAPRAVIVRRASDRPTRFAASVAQRSSVSVVPGASEASFSSSAPPGGTAISASLKRMARKIDHTTQDGGMLSACGQIPPASGVSFAADTIGGVDDAGQHDRDVDAFAHEFGAQRLGEPDQRELASRSSRRAARSRAGPRARRR